MFLTVIRVSYLFFCSRLSSHWKVNSNICALAWYLRDQLKMHAYVIEKRECPHVRVGICITFTMCVTEVIFHKLGTSKINVTGLFTAFIAVGLV